MTGKRESIRLPIPVIRKGMGGALALLCAFGGGCRTPPAYHAELEGWSVNLEIAANPSARARGLMFRETLPENHGMLFIFPEEQVVSFWMKNTSLPLDIAFMDASGTVVKTAALLPHDETPVSSGIPVLYALEVNAGTFAREGIAPGTRALFAEDVLRIIAR